MTCFVRVTGVVAKVPGSNVDTDVIMPKQFLKGIDRSGLALGLFHDLRFDEQGAVRADFILNTRPFATTRFLIVGSNFGCGSSREHAVWGMLQYGIRAIIGTTFAGIFSDNSANNGLLLISLAPERLASLLAIVEADPGMEITIDLNAQQILTPAEVISFDIDAGRREALLKGLDRIGQTLENADAIRTFQTKYLASSPWLTQ
jgi:3-isopropylmalate/(R)-2-methylmalate dehydratase small subunit